MTSKERTRRTEIQKYGNVYIKIVKLLQNPFSLSSICIDSRLYKKGWFRIL